MDDAIDTRYSDRLSDNVGWLLVFHIAPREQADKRVRFRMPRRTGDQHEIEAAVDRLQ